jgi:sulfur-oxidizing protein SoxY
VPIAIEAALIDGRQIDAVTVIVDDNPSPVAAVFHVADRRERGALGVNIRLDPRCASSSRRATTTSI